MTHHSTPKIDIPLNDAGIALAQAIESYCKREKIPFDGIWCNCDNCRSRMEVVRATFPRAQGDTVDELRRVCFTYWQLFRRRAGQA